MSIPIHLKDQMNKSFELNRRRKKLVVNPKIFAFAHEVFGMHKIGAIIRTKFPKTKTSLQGIYFDFGRNYFDYFDYDLDRKSFDSYKKGASDAQLMPFDPYSAQYTIGILYDSVEAYQKAKITPHDIECLLLSELRKALRVDACVRSKIFAKPESLQVALVEMEIITMADLDDAAPMARAAFLEGDLGL